MVLKDNLQNNLEKESSRLAKALLFFTSISKYDIPSKRFTYKSPLCIIKVIEVSFASISLLASSLTEELGVNCYGY